MSVKFFNMNSIERIKIIIQFINNRKAVLFVEILEKLQEIGIKAISERTLQRDIKKIRELCLIQIEYDHKSKKYYIDEMYARDVEEWLNFFEIFFNAKTINELLVKSPNGIEYVDFDRNGQVIQDGVLKNLLNATFENRKINFSHFSFWNDGSLITDFEPYLLKQYLNRWYILGQTNKGEIRHFSLDRISNVIASNDFFKRKIKDPKTFYDNAVGVIYSLDEIHDITLSFIPAQGKYIKTQPMHQSQEILVDNENELRIRLHVCTNYELEEQILKHGEKVKVISPDFLKERIKERIRKMAEIYN